jgi:hypothetical protein
LGKENMNKENTKKECFIISPIADVDGYPEGHFKQVYENIIKPACELCDLTAIRADDVKQTNLIHLDILQKLIDSPIAICDLSTRNPNVLFELGIRQAFDKPVVLIQEIGTSKIFDITPLRYLEYSKEMKYHDVLRSQKELHASIQATIDADGENGNVNSIVKLLGLSSGASIPDIQGDKKESMALNVMHSEMKEMRRMMEMLSVEGRLGGRGSISAIEYERMSSQLEQLLNTKRIPREQKNEELHKLRMECEEIFMHARDESEHMHFRNLMKRIERSI